MNENINFHYERRKIVEKENVNVMEIEIKILMG
jgi:hypothetical protein